MQSRPSAAPLRLTPAPAGPGGHQLALRIVKRRGPPLLQPLVLALAPVLSAPARRVRCATWRCRRARPQRPHMNRGPGLAAPVTPMLWFAVHLPWLSLEAFAATLTAEQRQRPLALLAEHQIQAVNAAAADAGIKPGLKRATALALAPELLLGQADATRDAQALQAVVHTALAFTPSVALDGGTVLLEVASCLRYFGGADTLLQRLRAALAPLGHRLQIAAAPTALGAALLARWRDDRAGGPQRTQLPARTGPRRRPGVAAGSGS